MMIIKLRKRLVYAIQNPFLLFVLYSTVVHDVLLGIVPCVWSVPAKTGSVSVCMYVHSFGIPDTDIFFNKKEVLYYYTERVIFIV